MSEIIRLDRVTRRFATAAETIVAVDAVSFSVGAGEVVALVGPSGSGKTTTINMMLGWEQPDEGVVTCSAEGVGWSAVSVIPQELGLLPELTALENAGLAGRLGAQLPRELDDLFDLLGLGALGDRFPDELSMGEQQRVAVARAVAPSPRLLVADEPTAHQDERRADVVMERLAAVAADGGAVVVATHDERLLEGVDRVIEMLDGRVVGTSDEASVVE